MAKHFKSKKHIRKSSIIKYIIYILIAFIFIRLYIYSLTSISPISYFNEVDIIKDHFINIKDNTINKPIVLLNYKYDGVYNTVVTKPVINLETINKKIYIYNTHQKESYTDDKTVMDASLYFKNQLEKNDIDVVVENGNIQEFLNTNNYTYNYSYVASRYYIKEELSKNNYDLIIDLHRDAASKDRTTTTIDGSSYAMIMFVIGKENKNYKENYAVAQAINNLILEKYPTLTRGILVQGGVNVNGIYNQDLNKNIILIELGGHKNNYDEVQNTIELLTIIIGEYLYGEKI